MIVVSPIYSPMGKRTARNVSRFEEKKKRVSSSSSFYIFERRELAHDKCAEVEAKKKKKNVNGLVFLFFVL